MTAASDLLDFGPCLDIGVHSSAGSGPFARLENQDNYLLIDGGGKAIFLFGQREHQVQIPKWPAGHMRLAVLDGMGGHGHGREAAEAVVAGLLATPACATLAELGAHLDTLHANLQHHFSNAANADADRRPGTTLTMLELRPGLPALLYHVGDSRLYELREGRIMPMTVDHVPATAFAMEGILGEDDWWQQVHGEHRSHISQAFILGNAFANQSCLSDPLYELSPLNLPPFLYHMPDRRAFELEADAVYVLASDGLWACIDPPDWVAHWPALLAPQIGAQAMADTLIEAMGARPISDIFPDNVTAIVIRPIKASDVAT